MTLIKWNPRNSLYNDFDHMIDSIFNDGWNKASTTQPNSIPVDITENENAFTLSADFPGFDKKEINLQIEDDQLTLSANHKETKQTNKESYRIKERHAGTIKRSFMLPDNILSEKINAKFFNGSLTISLPKTEEVKVNSRKIKIN